MFELPSLKFKTGELEPYFDEETIRVHYTKHHQTYADRLNQALAKYEELAGKDLTKLIYNAERDLPEDIRLVVVNNGGGYLNHNFFWQILRKPLDNANAPDDMIIDDLFSQQYGGYENFQKLFTDQALSVFGSGWLWLAITPLGKLEIFSTANQALPAPDKKVVLCLDLWEHAYYLKYQNRRNEYINAFYHVIDWLKVDELIKLSGVKLVEG